MKKITYILANVDKAIAFEWIAEKLNANNFFQLSFILLHEKEPYLYRWLTEKGIEVHYLPHFGKKSYPKNFINIIRLLQKINPDIIHCHLLDANLLGLSAAKVLGIKQRIYTRHHSTFHHDYFPKAVKYDNYCNKIATDIVAISENVKQVLIEKEHVSPSKIHLIHHGFDIEQFKNVSKDRIEQLKQKYHITENDYPIVGVIARYIQLKGHEYIIPAFKQVLQQYPQAKLILANASGADKDFVKQLLNRYLQPHQYIEISFEPDLFALYQLFDIYVHTPVDKHIEAFGQTYIEALATGIPSVFTLSGVAREFVKHEQNALTVPFKDRPSITKSIIRLLQDKNLAEKLVQNGQSSIYPFSLENSIKKLENLYR